MPTPTDPPIGSATNSAADCSPCAEQPTDCTKAIIDLKNELCSLDARYNELVRKYGMLQSKLATQALNNSQFMSELERIRRLISEMDSGGAGCSGLTEAENADSILVCDGGTQKALKPGSNCARIFGKEGKWKVGGPHIHWLSSAQTLVVGANSSLNDYDEVVADGCILAAIVTGSVLMSGASAAGGSRTYSANGVNIVSVGFSGGGQDFASGQSLVPLEEKLITITASTSGSGATFTPGFALLGYLVG